MGAPTANEVPVREFEPATVVTPTRCRGEEVVAGAAAPHARPHSSRINEMQVQRVVHADMGRDALHATTTR